jgi:diacylglycerol kinase family enzyme
MTIPYQELNSCRRLHLLANARSGQGHGADLAAIAEKLCAELGADLTVYEIKSPQDLTDQARKAVSLAQNSPLDIVVAAGGDGTIRSVAAIAAGTKVKMAVVPCGTFNFFARTHSIPEDQEQALRLALTGESKSIRLGDVNGNIFLINASLGLYAQSIQDREASTKRFGRKQLVIILSTIWSLLKPHRLLHVKIKAGNVVKEIRTPMIFVGNNALQLRNLSLTVAKGFKHDLLAVVTLKPVRGWEMLRVIFRGIAKTLGKEERLTQFSTDSLTIATKRSPQLVALDGEMFYINSPLVVQAMPEALNLIVPMTVLKDNTL